MHSGYTLHTPHPGYTRSNVEQPAACQTTVSQALTLDLPWVTGSRTLRTVKDCLLSTVCSGLASRLVSAPFLKDRMRDGQPCLNQVCSATRCAGRLSVSLLFFFPIRGEDSSPRLFSSQNCSECLPCRPKPHFLLKTVKTGRGLFASLRLFVNTAGRTHRLVMSRTPLKTRLSSDDNLNFRQNC